MISANGFPPVAVVSKLVQEYVKDMYTQNNTKTHNTQNRKQTNKKTRKQT
jgi:hypothetical protein